MKLTNENLAMAHSNNVKWKNDLDFYKVEIELMREKLGEVSANNTSKEIKMLVSHFENQFIINSKIIDELENDINLKEDAIATELIKNPTAPEHWISYHYAELGGKLNIFKKLFTELHTSFNKFLSATL